MDKKHALPIYVIILVVLLVLIAIFQGVPWLVKNKVGDLGPAILPPKSDIVKIIEEQEQSEETQPQIGGPVDFPLKLPSSFKIGIFAKGLGSARDLEFSPGGVLLLSIPASGKVVALPDMNRDGKADEAYDVLINLRRPHGISFYNNKLFVVEETRVVRYAWNEASLTAKEDKVLFSLPAGGNHRTRSIAFNSHGQLFVSLGSTCNVCFEKHPYLAAVIVSDADGTNPRLYAKGLRNAVFITIHPDTDELWGTEMGRDFLGDNLPPDEINLIKEGDSSTHSTSSGFTPRTCYKIQAY